MNTQQPAASTLLLLMGLLVSCAASADSFSDYWFQGEAEITSYTLEQARYGEVHPGHAVMIFVTEDFSATKQVKLDRPERAGADRVPVLKLNATRKFNTGIYPYSMMTSVFAPIAGDHSALKVTTSSQEWCGHTFTQLNRRDGGYRFQQHSYFESEGELRKELGATRLEDDLWTMIRLNPNALPLGKLRMVPGTMFLRLSHIEPAAYPAVGSLTPAGEDGLMRYELSYPELERTLEIRFREHFPHEIEGWRESGRSGGRTLTTEAKRLRRLQSAYWQKNSLADAGLRKQLGLD